MSPPGGTAASHPWAKRVSSVGRMVVRSGWPWEMQALSPSYSHSCISSRARRVSCESSWNSVKVSDGGKAGLCCNRVWVKPTGSLCILH